MIAPLVIEQITTDKTGIVHIGTHKTSTYEKAVRRKPDVRKVYLKDIEFKIPPDISLILGEK